MIYNLIPYEILLNILLRIYKSCILNSDNQYLIVEIKEKYIRN
jgi:hypothetical protein